MDYISEIKARKNHLLKYYCKVDTVHRAKHGFWISAAHFDEFEKTCNADHLELAKDMFSVSIDTIVSCFGLIGGLYNYHRFQHLYDNDMKTKFKEVFSSTEIYDKERYTANHLLMSVVARYLAEELYPNDIKTNIFPDDPTCKKTILRILDEYVHEGDPEWNSGTYFAMHFVPLWMLGEYACNENIRNKSKLVANWLLAKASATWLEGHWAIPQERAYKPFAEQNEYCAGTIILMLLFGGVKVKNYTQAEAYFAIPIAISDYVPPKILMDLIEERDQPYVHKERHYYHLEDRIHFYDPNLTEEGRMTIKNDVFHTSYINKTYAMFSSVEYVEPKKEYLEFMDRYYIQMHRWGVCFTGRPGPSVFYLEHPSGVKVENSGATAWERVLQYKSSLIGIYNIPTDRKSRYLEHFLPKDLREHPHQITAKKLRLHNQYIMGYIPTNYVKCINQCEDGRIYIDYGNFMLALHLSDSFNWHEHEYTFRCETKKLAFAVEISDRCDNLEVFKNVVDLKFDKIRFHEDDLTLEYESIDNVNMKLQFLIDGTRNDYISGTSVDYKNWPLIYNPWMKQDFMGNELIVKHKNDSLIYKFK